MRRWPPNFRIHVKGGTRLTRTTSLRRSIRWQSRAHCSYYGVGLIFVVYQDYDYFIRIGRGRVTGPELVTVGQGDEWVAPLKQPATEPSRAGPWSGCS